MKIKEIKMALRVPNAKKKLFGKLFLGQNIDMKKSRMLFEIWNGVTG